MEKKDILYPLRRLHGFCHDWLLKKRQNFQYSKYLGKKCGAPQYFVIDTPEHVNLGDSAIVLAQFSFLEKCGISRSDIKEITSCEHIKYNKIIKKCVRPKDIIVIDGGGSMGDQWFAEEKKQRTVLTDFPQNKVIIFPQTIYYSDTPFGHAEQEKSVPVYNGRAGLILVAREKKSFEIMQKLYPDTPVLLTPDIVLSASGTVLGLQKQKRQDVLLCFRNDAEQAMTQQERQAIEAYLQAKNSTYRFTDMYSDCPVNKENRRECVQKKINEFASAELIITDRLHGMLFAAIAETPCIVFGNYNQKVEGTYEWIKYLPYIRFVKSTKEAERAYAELKDMKNCKFDNAPLAPYFEKLAELVKKYAAN